MTDAEKGRLNVTCATIEKMLSNQRTVDTDAFLYVYRQLMRNLSNISAERALGREWDEHPMFGIASDKCHDKWAMAYRESNQLAEAVFTVLIERSNAKLTGEASTWPKSTVQR